MPNQKRAIKNSRVKYLVWIWLSIFAFVFSVTACFNPELISHKWPHDAHFPNNIFNGTVMAIISLVNFYIAYKKYSNAGGDNAS